jgi:hypothetical protein
MQGMAAAEQGKQQAKIGRQQANYARLSAASDEREYRDRLSREAATRRALLGAAGVDPGTGSPLAASEDFASETELQALKLRAGGDVTATRLEQQARLTRMAGQNELTGSFVRGGSLLLSGAADGWNSYNKLHGG